MAGRKIGNEQEARRLLRAAHTAGVGRAAWARSQGIDARSLNAWRVNLGRPGGVAPRPRSQVRAVTPTLVELVPMPASATSAGARAPGSSERPARYVLRVAGVSLELGDDFNEQTVRRLVGLLRSC